MRYKACPRQKINIIETLRVACLLIRYVVLNWMKALQSTMNIGVCYTIFVVKDAKEFSLESRKNTLNNCNRDLCINNRL
jgi:hypothetical protein